MIYVIYGLEKFLVDEQIKRIIKENNIEELSISKFNAKIDDIDNIFLAASQMSLFGTTRLILIEESFFFTPNSGDEIILNKVYNFLNDYKGNNIVIFSFNSEKMDERKKISKLAKKNCKVFEFNTKKDSSELIKELLKEYKINSKIINLIKEKVNNSIELIPNEIEKLKLYKEDKEITEDDVNNVISNYPNIDFFNFIYNIINKNVKASLVTYNELLKLKEEPIKIIVTLANQFRLMYQSKKLSQSGYLEKDIALELGEHPYRVKLAIMKANKYDDNILLENLEKLGEINLKAKKGLIDSKSALELFILEMQ